MYGMLMVLYQLGLSGTPTPPPIIGFLALTDGTPLFLTDGTDLLLAGE